MQVFQKCIKLTLCIKLSGLIGSRAAELRCRTQNFISGDPISRLSSNPPIPPVSRVQNFRKQHKKATGSCWCGQENVVDASWALSFPQVLISGFWQHLALRYLDYLQTHQFPLFPEFKTFENNIRKQHGVAGAVRKTL